VGEKGMRELNGFGVGDEGCEEATKENSRFLLKFLREINEYIGLK